MTSGPGSTFMAGDRQSAQSKATKANEVVKETVEVPEHCVGLVIGRGGEYVSRIETSTGCRVQMDDVSGENQMRPCMLTGTRAGVDRARNMIQTVVERAIHRPPPPPNRNRSEFAASGGQRVSCEVLVPGQKCGVIIGKGGETIKKIQSNYGVSATIVQESAETGMKAKPLRITGELRQVEAAVREVERIINSYGDLSPSSRGFDAAGYGQLPPSPQRSFGEVIVPRSSVGMIIGKGGETIKRIAAETGAMIQFKPDDDKTKAERWAVIEGTVDQINRATQIMSEIVNRSGAVAGSDTFCMRVPSDKTGLVIGKRGESIKQICAESGAHVEISREQPPSLFEKVFIIKGTPEQVYRAQYLISVKIGSIASSAPHQQSDARGTFSAGGLGVAMGSARYDSGSANQLAPPAGVGQWNGNYGEMGQSHWSQSVNPNVNASQYQQLGSQFLSQTSHAAAGPNINSVTGEADYSAEWAEYYRSVGMFEQAAMIENQRRQDAAAASRLHHTGYGAYSQTFLNGGEAKLSTGVGAQGQSADRGGHMQHYQ